MERYSPEHQFELVPSVPKDESQCPYHIDPSDPKMRSEKACEYERVTLCAMDALANLTGTMATNRSATFLQCLDDAPLTLAYNSTWPRACALQVGGAPTWDRAAACFAGERGGTLLTRAQRATAQAHSGIPSVQIDGATVCGNNGVHCSFDVVASRLDAV